MLRQASQGRCSGLYATRATPRATPRAPAVSVLAGGGGGVQRADVGQHVDVAVVGGGPAGLAAAAALRVADPSLSVHVFEKSDMRARGAAVTVSANGLRALAAVDRGIVDRLLERAIRLEGTDRYDSRTDEHLELVPSRDAEHDRAYGFHDALLSWSDVTASLRAVLPDGALTTGRAVSGFRELPGSGGIELLGGGQEVLGACRALVGADGWFSPIRQQLLADGPPAFRDVVVFRARVAQPAWMAGGGSGGRRTAAWWAPPGGPSPAELTAGVTPVPGGDVVWQVHCPVSILQIKGLEFDPVRGEDQGSAHADHTNTDPPGGGCCGCGACSTSSANTKQRCIKVVDSLPGRIRELVASTPGSAISEHGLYQRTAEQIQSGGWGRGMVTLVGDAAHTAYLDGTGVGLSFEDAAVLGLHVRGRGLTEAALRAFEAERIPRVKAVFGLSAQQAAAAAAGAPQHELVSRRAELLYGQAAAFEPLQLAAAAGLDTGRA